MKILKPCQKPFCAFYEEMIIKPGVSLTNTPMPHVFGNLAKVCIACTHFVKFDLYEASDSYQPGKVRNET